jgi:hypothetical protein
MESGMHGGGCMLHAWIGRGVACMQAGVALAS